MRLAILIGIGHLIRILQTLQQRQRPVEVTQYIIHLAFRLCAKGRLHHIDGLTLAGLEDFFYLTNLDPAYNMNIIGFVLQHLLLRIGQRGLRIGIDGVGKLRLLVQLAIAVGGLQRTMRLIGHAGGNLANQATQRLTFSLSDGLTPPFAVDVVFTVPDSFPSLRKHTQGRHHHYQQGQNPAIQCFLVHILLVLILQSPYVHSGYRHPSLSEYSATYGHPA